ncbi:MAG TPA: sigma factor-like helix-turn-helix DNA-binding protein [Polyangiaceae bacterium]|nr:sigma factor-like helix-turn-helix DNA-binding protein [Polyangiaceae bacterium]
MLAYFAAARPDLDAPADLGNALRGALDAAREAWPELALPAEAFVRFLAEKIPERARAEQALASLRTDDLYLTLACARGDASAIARFERLLAPAVDRAIARVGGAAGQRKEDVLQRVRQRLLVPRAADGTAPPRVADYSGRGSLSAWVQVIALRGAVDVLQRHDRERPAEGDVLETALGSDAGPELAHLKRLYRDEFKAAFAEAIAALSPRERRLLRQHALDGLSIDKLAALHKVHRATAARWVEAARKAAFEHTRLALGRRLRVGPDELDSVMRLLESRLDVTLSPLLREPDEAAPAPAPGPPGPRRGAK